MNEFNLNDGRRVLLTPITEKNCTGFAGLIPKWIIPDGYSDRYAGVGAVVDGCASGVVIIRFSAGNVELHWIAVSEAFRGLGLAENLLDFLLQRIMETRLRYLTCLFGIIPKYVSNTDKLLCRSGFSVDTASANSFCVPLQRLKESKRLTAPPDPALRRRVQALETLDPEFLQEYIQSRRAAGDGLAEFIDTDSCDKHQSMVYLKEGAIVGCFIVGNFGDEDLAVQLLQMENSTPADLLTLMQVTVQSYLRTTSAARLPKGMVHFQSLSESVDTLAKNLLNAEPCEKHWVFSGVMMFAELCELKAAAGIGDEQPGCSVTYAQQAVDLQEGLDEEIRATLYEDLEEADVDMCEELERVLANGPGAHMFWLQRKQWERDKETMKRLIEAKEHSILRGSTDVIERRAAAVTDLIDDLNGRLITASVESYWAIVREYLARYLPMPEIIFVEKAEDLIGPNEKEQKSYKLASRFLEMLCCLREELSEAEIAEFREEYLELNYNDLTSAIYYLSDENRVDMWPVFLTESLINALIIELAEGVPERIIQTDAMADIYVLCGVMGIFSSDAACRFIE